MFKGVFEFTFDFSLRFLKPFPKIFITELPRSLFGLFEGLPCQAIRGRPRLFGLGFGCESGLLKQLLAPASQVKLSDTAFRCRWRSSSSSRLAEDDEDLPGFFPPLFDFDLPLPMLATNSTTLVFSNLLFQDVPARHCSPCSSCQQRKQNRLPHG